MIALQQSFDIGLYEIWLVDDYSYHLELDRHPDVLKIRALLVKRNRELRESFGFSNPGQPS